MACSLSPLVESARSEFAGCLRIVQDGPDGGTDDLGSHVSAFLDVAQRLLQGFKQAAQQTKTLSRAELMRDIEELQREQQAKGELIARHREQLLKWSAECQAIEAAQSSHLALSAEYASPARH